MEAVVLVELLGSIVKGMDDQGADACVLGNHDCPADGVLKQGASELDALRTMVDRQPRQHHHWNGIRHIPFHTARELEHLRCTGLITARLI